MQNRSRSRHFKKRGPSTIFGSEKEGVVYQKIPVKIKYFPDKGHPPSFGPSMQNLRE
jgi:hypothetical protein